MAKRKRLSPPTAAHLDQVGASAGVVLPRPTAPIADVARDSSAVAALEEMSQSWNAARDEGRMVLNLAHADIRLDHLHRDRVGLDPDELTALKQSLLERGQQTPIEVVALADGAGYGLLSGWRRCQTLRALHAETGEARFATVQALVRRPADAGGAYRTMIEENEIRANLSHYERARIVVKAVEAGVFETEKEALAALYGAVPRARRSKIRSFLAVVHALEGAVKFPEAISERMGLELSKKLGADPALGRRLSVALKQSRPDTAQDEQAVIMGAVAPDPAPKEKTLNNPLEPHIERLPASDGGLVAALPGVTVRRARGGALTLSGPALTQEMQAELIAWMKDRLG